ncbi:MAG: hypothetical protein IT370_09880 [Deltaproteobacteria bacterium]|nr:hypothetical protein [Deltaproteobacteria bacterium]
MVRRLAFVSVFVLAVTAGAAGTIQSGRQSTRVTVSSGTVATARRESPWGLLFPTSQSRSLVVTGLGGEIWREFVAPCGAQMKVYKLHASPRTPHVVFTCADSADDERAIMMIDLYRHGEPAKTLVRGRHTLLGWSPDGERIYYWDNSLQQRGHIISRDPFANVEDRHYCCATVAMPGPGRSVIGIDHGDADRLLELRPGGDPPREIVSRAGHISEIDASADGELLYIGIRPDERSYASYALEEVAVATGRTRHLMRVEGHHWLHRVAGDWALVNQVTGCVLRNGKGRLESPCEDAWMVLSPQKVSLATGTARVISSPPRVAGYWLTPDGAMLLVREWDKKEDSTAYYLRPDGRRLGPAPNQDGYGDPMWVRIGP